MTDLILLPASLLAILALVTLVVGGSLAPTPWRYWLRSSRRQRREGEA